MEKKEEGQDTKNWDKKTTKMTRRKTKPQSTKHVVEGWDDQEEGHRKSVKGTTLRRHLKARGDVVPL